MLVCKTKIKVPSQTKGINKLIYQLKKLFFQLLIINIMVYKGIVNSQPKMFNVGRRVLYIHVSNDTRTLQFFYT